MLIVTAPHIEFRLHRTRSVHSTVQNRYLEQVVVVTANLSASGFGDSSRPGKYFSFKPGGNVPVYPIRVTLTNPSFDRFCYAQAERQGLHGYPVDLRYPQAEIDDLQQFRQFSCICAGIVQVAHRREEFEKANYTGRIPFEYPRAIPEQEPWRTYMNIRRAISRVPRR